MAEARRGPSIREAARLLAAGDLVGAEQAARQLIRRNKRDANAWQLLGTVALHRGANDEALRHYRKCVDLKPKEAHFQYLVGKALAVLGRVDEAITRLEKALKLQPGYPLAVTWLAASHERRGDIEKARALLDPWVGDGRDNPDMADIYARILTHENDDEGVVRVTGRHLATNDLEPRCREALSYHAGRALDRLGRADEAFEAFSVANRIAGGAFEPEAYVRTIDRIIATFSEATLAALPRSRVSSDVPVFIAAMPRSGTTLVEQIIDAHPAAAGLGELTEVHAIAGDLPRLVGSTQAFPECVRQLDQETCDRQSRRYLEHVGRLAGRVERAVNKSLENYKLLGLISVLWPGARIIHCRREPMDTCLSCFMSHILPSVHPYKTDLRHLGLVYRQYVRLMEHWQHVLDLPMLEVVYEDLVASPEPGIREIIEFCGLPWDVRCLEFHASGRTVMTISYDQVRRPMYGSAVNRAQRYAHLLGPLREALGDLAPSEGADASSSRG